MIKFVFFVLLAVAMASAMNVRLVGAPEEGDTNSVEVKEMLTKVLASQNSSDKVTKVLKVTKQVVAGVKYTVVFESENAEAGTKYTCTADFVSQPWVTKEPQVLSYTCDNRV
ncbi:uncharacterized protein LOC106666190 [Cimex lectularius]|uniref:Cystatin domain-containing protein n=1 Tax=Cimex lectularius TaxID=79782 RepID=A0A8I6RNJ0_CIMLE|nr:uncharacterized protein LOC106666190 [Cimex lectularius]